MTEAEVEEMEKKLYEHVQSVYGANAAKLESAAKLALEGRKNLKRAREILGEVEDAELDWRLVEYIKRQFREKFPVVDVPKDVERRNPAIFSTASLVERQCLQKEQRTTANAKYIADDEKIIERFLERKQAAEKILYRSNDLIKNCRSNASVTAQNPSVEAEIPEAVLEMDRLYM